MNFTIEKGIPLNPRKNEGGKYDVLPLSQMIEGDSIFVPFTFASKHGIGNYISMYKGMTNTKFTIRIEKEGVRIFKLA